MRSWYPLSRRTRARWYDDACSQLRSHFRRGESRVDPRLDAREGIPARGAILRASPERVLEDSRSAVRLRAGLPVRESDCEPARARHRALGRHAVVRSQDESRLRHRGVCRSSRIPLRVSCGTTRRSTPSVSTAPRQRASWRKHVLPQLPQAGDIAYHRLPSTSPANASIGYDDKVKAWGILRRSV